MSAQTEKDADCLVDRYPEFSADHPTEWRRWSKLWCAGMKRGMEIEKEFLGANDFYEAEWKRTTRNADGTSTLAFHAREWGAFRFVAKAFPDAMSRKIRTPDVPSGDNESVSKMFEIQWPYADRPVPFPCGGSSSDTPGNEVVLAVDSKGKVIGWKYEKSMVLAARKRPDGQVEVVLADEAKNDDPEKPIMRDFVYLFPHYLDLQNSWWTNVIYTTVQGLAVFPSIHASSPFGDGVNELEAQKKSKAGWKPLNQPDQRISPGRDGWIAQLKIPRPKNEAVSGFEEYIPASQVVYEFPFMDHHPPLRKVD